VHATDAGVELQGFQPGPRGTFVDVCLVNVFAHPAWLAPQSRRDTVWEPLRGAAGRHAMILNGLLVLIHANDQIEARSCELYVHDP
jgi:hypothetical protein